MDLKFFQEVLKSEGAFAFFIMGHTPEIEIRIYFDKDKKHLSRIKWLDEFKTLFDNWVFYHMKDEFAEIKNHINWDDDNLNTDLVPGKGRLGQMNKKKFFLKGYSFRFHYLGLVTNPHFEKNITILWDLFHKISPFPILKQELNFIYGSGRI